VNCVEIRDLELPTAESASCDSGHGQEESGGKQQRKEVKWNFLVNNVRGTLDLF
jgi:hypothetical protein